MFTNMADDRECGNDNTELHHQYSSSVIRFSSQYGSENSLSYTVTNLAGPSCTFPRYGDFTQACVFRTYGPWWREAPSCPVPFKRTPTSFTSEDFVELQFETEVFPVRVEIMETYNPGAVVRILVCDATKPAAPRWVPVWQGKPHQAPATSRIFTCDLRKVNFSTSLVRLELCHINMNYYTELDAVRLHGIIPPPPWKQKAQPSTPPPERSSYTDPPPDYWSVVNSEKGMVNSVEGGENTAEHIDSSGESKIPGSLVDNLSKLHLRDGLSAALEVSHNGFFDLLPNEVIQLLLQYLDMPAICNLASTCRLLHKHCYDPLLYTELDLQPYWHQICDSSLDSLQGRCRFIQQLSLSWCGSHGELSVSGLDRFLFACGKELTCLRLACCSFVNNDALAVLVNRCPNLKELDIQGNRSIDNVGFLNLTRLPSLKRLNLYRTMVDVYSLIAIIRCCPGLEHLNIGACSSVHNFDDVAIELGKNCKQLRSVDFWRARTLSEIGLRGLANNCALLEELDCGWCQNLRSTTGCITELVEKCNKIKKLFLTANRTVSDNDLDAIARHCPLLEQLDILGTREVSQQVAYKVLQSCKKLRFFDVSFCAGIDFITVHAWKEQFPDVSIKKSFQS